MFTAEQEKIEKLIKAFCMKNGLPEPTLQWTWIPYSGNWGISTSFFQLAALEARQGKGGNVGLRAQEIADKVVSFLGVPEGFERVESSKGYLNLYYSSAEYSRRLLDEVIKSGANFGRGLPTNKQVMVEFSHPNTHKAFHVGHLRSAILGDVLCRILEFAGNEVIRANYPGDIGLHVIRWLWNYSKYHAGERPSKNITQWMGTLYAEAIRRLDENPELDAEVRAYYVRWDQHDPEITSLWNETREWSLEGFREIYDLLDIRFDRYYFNSMFEAAGKEMVQDLIQKGLASDERPDGAVVVKLDELLGLKQEKYRVMVVLRSDGTALYATEDLALARQKFLDYPDLERSYYIVDVRQSLHFVQVFKTLELAGYTWAQRCQHIPYELVNLPGNVIMASREGTVVLLEDLIRESTERALAVVKEKNPDLSEEQQLKVAQAVGIGAIKYPIISRENTKVVTFDWETALNFNGQAAPYIQYAYVRAGSILRKIDDDIPPSMLPAYPLETAEIDLINMISRFPGEVQKAANGFKPLDLANLAFELAQAFNNFYTRCPVLQANTETRAFRLRLVAAARQAIFNGLTILGIPAPDVM